jgi:hypothetical protein
MIVDEFFSSNLYVFQCFILVLDAKWRAPKFLMWPKKAQRVGFAEMVRNLVPFPASSTKRGRGVMLEAPGLD